MNDDLDQCQYTCMTLLRNDKENEEATVMMADLAFRKNDYESAMFHFQQVYSFKQGYIFLDEPRKNSNYVMLPDEFHFSYYKNDPTILLP